MKPEEFVAGLRQTIVEENAEIYRDLFETTEAATDPYWTRALAFYAALDNDQKCVFCEILRQVAIDSVSNLLAVLDGATVLDGQDQQFLLQSGSDQISGELQNLFLQQFDE